MIRLPRAEPLFSTLLRCARSGGAFVIALALLSSADLLGQEAISKAPVGEKSAATDVISDPQVQEALDKAVERATKTRKRQATDELSVEVADWTESLKLDEDQQAALATAAEKAVDDSIESWSKDFEQFLETQLRRMANRYAYQKSNLLQQLGGRQIDTSVARFRGPDNTHPRSQKAWQEGLASVAPKEKLEAWKKEIADDSKKRTEAIKTFLDDLEKTIQESQVELAEPILRDVLKITNADDAQRKNLRKLVEDVIMANLKQWREETTYVLERVEEERWKSFSQMGSPEELTRSPRWTEALGKILAADQKEAWDKEVARIEAELDKKLSKIVKNESPKMRAEFAPQMKLELEQLIEIVTPTPEVVAKLEKASEKTIDASLMAWEEAAKQMFPRLPKEIRTTILDSEKFRYRPSLAGLKPGEQDTWKDAINSLLTPEQAISWKAELAKRAEENEKRLADMVDATADSYEIQFETMLEPKVADVVGSLELDEKRAEAFREAGKTAIRESLESWKQNARDWLEGLNAAQREEYTRQGRVPLGYSSEDAADKQPAWTNAFSDILTKEEQERWTDLQTNRKKKRETAAAGLMLSLIEEWVGLKPDQWTAISEIFREKSEPIHTQFTEQHFYVNLNQVAQAIQKVDEEKLRKFLTDAQWERWEKAVKVMESSNQSRAKKPGENEEIPPGPNLVFVEDAITEVIYQRNRERKDETLMLLLAEIETGADATKLSEDLVDQLRTAAKGATEEVVNQWDGSFVKYARGRVQGATPKTIRGQLASVGNYNSRKTDPKDTGIWKKSLRLILSEEEQALWNQTSQDRSDARSNAIMDMVVVYFESRLGLSSEQGPKFRTLLAESLDKYGPDIKRYFSSYSSPWFFRYYSIGLPVMGIPEKKLKSLLSKEQWITWEQQFQPNAANYWDNIQRYHEQRIKSEQEQKKKSEKKS